MNRRADLAGVDRVVSEVLDDIWRHQHGLTPAVSHHRELLNGLARRGYQVTAIPVRPCPMCVKDPDSGGNLCANHRAIFQAWERKEGYR